MTVVSKENVNVMLLNEKLEAFIKENKLTAVEPKCRLVKMVLRGDVHHFPKDIPFIASVIKCNDGYAAFFIKRKKLAFIEDGAVASETKVGDSFEIDNVRYVVEDTINGFPRFKPEFSKVKK